MPERGRPRKPTALKALEGNRGKRPLPENEPKPAPVVETPDPPSWINKEGKQIWKQLFPQLKRIGILTSIDINSFEALCYYYGEWREGIREIKKNGKYYLYTNKAGATNEIERPIVKITQKAFENYKSMCTEFGLTASSRTRIEVKIDDEGVDPMEMLLSK